MKIAMALVVLAVFAGAIAWVVISLRKFQARKAFEREREANFMAEILKAKAARPAAPAGRKSRPRPGNQPATQVGRQPCHRRACRGQSACGRGHDDSGPLCFCGQSDCCRRNRGCRCSRCRRYGQRRARRRRVPRHQSADPLAVLLIVSIVYCYLIGRYLPAAFLSALALLTRPDALLLIGPLALDRLIQYIRQLWSQQNNIPEELSAIQKRRANIRQMFGEICVFIAPILLWGIFSVAYFGNPLPHSIAAKSVAYRLPAHAAFIRLVQHYAPPVMDNLTFGAYGIGIGLVLYPFLYLVGTSYTLRLSFRIWPFLLSPWLYFFVYSIANPLIFRWYLTPPLTALFLIILIGADQTIQRLARWVESKWIKHPQHSTSTIATWISLVCVGILPCLLLLRGWTLNPDHGISRPAPLMAWYQLELLYQQAADQLKEDINIKESQPLLAAGDVGVLGYFTGMRILDTVGLNSPQSVKYYPADPSYYLINYAIPPELILDMKPDLIVILEIYGRGGLINDDRFQEFYRLRDKIPADIYGSDGMLIFERVQK